eukprot:193588-Rhodomonas_salina.3
MRSPGPGVHREPDSRREVESGPFESVGPEGEREAVFGRGESFSPMIDRPTRTLALYGQGVGR